MHFDYLIVECMEKIGVETVGNNIERLMSVLESYERALPTMTEKLTRAQGLLGDLGVVEEEICEFNSMHAMTENSMTPKTARTGLLSQLNYCL